MKTVYASWDGENRTWDIMTENGCESFGTADDMGQYLVHEGYKVSAENPLEWSKTL